MTTTAYPKRLLVPDVAAPGDRVMGQQDAQNLVERITKLSRADDAQVSINSLYQANLRFADNRISTSGGVATQNVTVQSSFGPKHAVVTTGDLSDAGLERAVRQSEALAKLAPDDPEAMPALGPQQYAPVQAWFDNTAQLPAAARTEAARVAIDAAKAAGDVTVAGYIVTSAFSQAVGNKHGLFGYFPTTASNYTLTARTTDGTGSGWAGADHPDWTKVDFRAVAERAIQKARLSRNPQAVEPGRYTVILEPQAVGDLVQLLSFAMDARSSDEGRGAFSKQGGGTKIGQKIVDPRVTLYSDPTDPLLLSNTFDGQGLPMTRQVWIENGVLKNLSYTRFWAQKKGVQPTGFPGSLAMAGGQDSLDQMIASTPRGILVTRLWYLRPVDPRTVLYTGLTRDGTFLIENGKITRAVKNMRFNESPLFMLNNLDMIGRPERLAGTEAGGDVVLPPIKVHDFNFTSLSDAV